MENSKKFEAAAQFRELAEQNSQNENLPDACFYYINCLKLKPEWKSELKNNFLLVLSRLGQLLEKQQQFPEIFIIYEEALKLYSESEEVHHNLGAHLLRLGYPNKAAYYFKEALKRNEDYFPAFRSLHSSYCALIERWHYRMLNDSHRNEAYREAITKKIKQGFDTLLDIGTGTGLFCLYAQEAGAKKVYACDNNPTMISIAKNVFENASSPNKICLIEKHSSEVEIPDDMDLRVSLVVTETLDSCIFGEGMLQSLKHAWENLLLPVYKFEHNKPISNDANNNGIIIPHSGSLWFAGIHSNLLARKYVFPLTDLYTNECADAFANISLKDNLFPENVRVLSLKSINLFAPLSEPYDTDRLQSTPDCTFLTEPRQLFHVNFNDPLHIERCLHGKNSSTQEITCTRSGYFHAIAAWFRVQLDEEIVLSSAPDDFNSKNCCWDQAIFPASTPYKVVPGCKISLSSDWTHGKVTFNVDRLTYPDGSVFSELQATAPTSVTGNVITMLNDSNLLEHLKIAALEFLSTLYGTRSVIVMDTFPFPIFGLNVLCNAHLINLTYLDVRVVCVVQSREDILAIRKVCEINQLPFSQLSFIVSEDFDEHVGSLQHSVFDAIMVNFIDVHGDLDEDTISRIGMLKSLLKEKGHLLPKSIKICGQFIHSDYIEESMRALNGDVQRYGISKAINEYQVWQMLEINAATLQFQKYSNPFVCHHFFAADELDCRFETSFFATCVRSGSVNSILYWYNVTFFGDRHYYSTLQEYAYVSQAAYLTKSPATFYENDKVLLKFVYHHGAFIVLLC